MEGILGETVGNSYLVTGVTGGCEGPAGNNPGNDPGNKPRSASHLPDKLAEVQRRLADLEAKAEELRQKIIALGQSTVAGERFIASVRTVAMRELDMDALRKRLNPDQFERCFKPVRHTVVTTHERGEDD